MAGSPHYKELLQLLNEYRVEYLIVGGYAVMKYSEPRYTKDLDIWVRDSEENSSRLFHALAKFGAPLDHDGITPQTFSQDGVVYQIGVAPLRVDVLTRITGVQFAEAWRNRAESVIFGVPVYFISRADLITNKRAAGRSVDIEDVNDIQNRKD